MGAATVTFTLSLPAVFREEGGWVVGEFPNLSVASQGRTRDEAERNLIEAAQAFLESCFERNQLDEALKECGFVPGHMMACLRTAGITRDELQTWLGKQ